jgi:ABC-type Fe3+ transport system permease subunit
MNDYLKLIAIPLGGIVQYLRGMGVPTRFLLPGTVIACAVFVWLSAPDDQSFKAVAREGVYWILLTVGAMFSTAFGAYAYAARGKNPEERSDRAQSPLVPVTDPNKPITK